MVSCSGSWSFQDWVPKLELGNQRVKEICLCIARSGLRSWIIGATKPMIPQVTARLFVTRYSR